MHLSNSFFSLTEEDSSFSGGPQEKGGFNKLKGNKFMLRLTSRKKEKSLLARKRKINRLLSTKKPTFVKDSFFSVRKNVIFLSPNYSHPHILSAFPTFVFNYHFFRREQPS